MLACHKSKAFRDWKPSFLSFGCFSTFSSNLNFLRSNKFSSSFYFHFQIWHFKWSDLILNSLEHYLATNVMAFHFYTQHINKHNCSALMPFNMIIKYCKYRIHYESRYSISVLIMAEDIVKSGSSSLISAL